MPRMRGSAISGNPFRRGSLDLDKKAARTSLDAFLKQSFTADGGVPVGGDLPYGHAHCFRLDPTLSGAREGLVGAYGRLWSVGMSPSNGCIRRAVVSESSEVAANLAFVLLL